MRVIVNQKIRIPTTGQILEPSPAAQDVADSLASNHWFRTCVAMGRVRVVSGSYSSIFDSAMPPLRRATPDNGMRFRLVPAGSSGAGDAAADAASAAGDAAHPECNGVNDRNAGKPYVAGQIPDENFKGE